MAKIKVGDRVRVTDEQEFGGELGKVVALVQGEVRIDYIVQFNVDATFIHHEERQFPEVGE